MAALAGHLQSKVFVVTLSLFDIHSSVQIFSAEGKAKASNCDPALNAFGSVAADGLLGFSRTPEGKATLTTFIDTWNSMIVALRRHRAQDLEIGLGTAAILKVN